jgi:hypothetical protein
MDTEKVGIDRYDGTPNYILEQFPLETLSYQGPRLPNHPFLLITKAFKAFPRISVGLIMPRNEMWGTDADDFVDYSRFLGTRDVTLDASSINHNFVWMARWALSVKM